MSDDLKCARCFSATHATTACRAGIRRAWPGHPAMRLGLRSAKGEWIELETRLTEDLFAEAMALLNRAVARPEKEGT